MAGGAKGRPFLLRGLRSLATLAEPEKFGPWLVGIAVRTCLDWLKSSQRSEVSLEAMGERDRSTAAGAAAVVDDHREAVDKREGRPVAIKRFQNGSAPDSELWVRAL